MSPEDPPGAPHRGWYRRYLPHFDGSELIQSITYRLADALPLTASINEPTTAARRARLEALLDAGHGSCILRAPKNAALVVDSWRHFDERHYRLHAWVVMPNHVHVIATILPGFPLARIVRDWKSFTAHAIRKQPGHGPVWNAGYWDRFIRDGDHYAAAVEYVERNPVRAGLVAHPEAWSWSSAAARRAGETPAVPAESSSVPRRALRDIERRRPRK